MSLKMNSTFQRFVGLFCDPCLQFHSVLEGCGTCPRSPDSDVHSLLSSHPVHPLVCFNNVYSSKPSDVFMLLEAVDLAPGRKTPHFSDCGIPRTHDFGRG